MNFAIVDELKSIYDKLLIDCTHSTQRSKSVYGTQGDPSLAKRYLRLVQFSAMMDYLPKFIENHSSPFQMENVR